jgi:hypothetical protein
VVVEVEWVQAARLAVLAEALDTTKRLVLALAQQVKVMPVVLP